MYIKQFDTTQNKWREEILNLLVLVDKDARGDNYEVSTADMSREMFDLPDFTSDLEALESFYDNLTDSVLLCIEDQTVIGLTLVQKNNAEILKVDETLNPHLSIIFSAVHPEYQRKGIWTELREEVEDNLIPEYTVDYLVSAASIENTASIEANKSMGMKEQGQIPREEEEGTILFLKEV